MKKIIFNLVLISAIPAILVVYFIVITKYLSDMEERGQFGDMFGAANALFSGFAFLGIIYTIYLQRKELNLQKEELRLTRDELARSARAQEESQVALAKQADSLKLTAKLNGLSSIMQFELAKPSTQSKLARDGIYTAFVDGDKIENVVKKIESIIADN